VYEKDEIILNRDELNIIKKFLLLQFLRTDFYKEKFDKAPSMIRNRMKNETPREQWIRYLKYVVSHNVDEMTKNADSPDLIKFHAKVINQLTYLCFLKAYGEMEFILPDLGIVKEPTTYFSYHIMPITPKLSILLVDIHYKEIVNDPRLSDVFQKNAIDFYFKDLVKTGYLGFMKDDMIEELSRINIPLIYLRANNNLYVSRLAKPSFINNLLVEIKKNNYEFSKYREKMLLTFTEIILYHGNLSPSDVPHPSLQITYLILLALSKSYEQGVQEFKKFKDLLFYVPSEMFLSEKDLFIYPINNIDPVVGAYLNAVLMEESYYTFAFKDGNGLVLSLMYRDIVERKLEMPDYPALKEHVRNIAPNEWQEALDQIKESKKLAKEFDYYSQFRTKIIIKE
jgi:hypothetical protein